MSCNEIEQVINKKVLEVHAMGAQAEEQVKVPVDYNVICKAQRNDTQIE